MVDVKAVPFDDSEEYNEGDSDETASDPIVEIFDTLEQYEFGYEDFIDILNGLSKRLEDVSEDDDEELQNKQKALANELNSLLEKYKVEGD